MGLEHLVDLLADAEHGIEARERILKDRADDPAAQSLEGFLIGEGNRALAEIDLAGDKRAGGEQAEDGKDRRTLAGTALSDQRGYLAGVEIEGEIVHGHRRLDAAGKGDPQIPDREDGARFRVHHAPTVRRSRSVSQSLIRLTASTVAAMARPGKATR